MTGDRPRPIDREWRRDHPLPPIRGGDKEARGRVLLVGGSMHVPGTPRLTAEAILRVGAGKVQLATIAEAAVPLGVLLPEVALIACPAEDGQIAGSASAELTRRLARADTLAMGCGMMTRPQTAGLVAALLDALPEKATALLDAGALTAVRDCAGAVRRVGARVVLTPHPGELSALADKDEAAITDDLPTAARDAAARFGAIVVLKSATTIVAMPDGTALCYVSEAPGLGTAGSGDVLAGIIAGLLARGAAPLVAAAWGVWLHGEAGKLAAARIGPTGFLARELAPALPGLLAAHMQG